MKTCVQVLGLTQKQPHVYEQPRRAEPTRLLSGPVIQAGDPCASGMRQGNGKYQCIFIQIMVLYFCASPAALWNIFQVASSEFWCSHLWREAPRKALLDRGLLLFCRVLRHHRGLCLPLLAGCHRGLHLLPEQVPWKQQGTSNCKCAITAGCGWLTFLWRIRWLFFQNYHKHPAHLSRCWFRSFLAFQLSLYAPIKLCLFVPLFLFLLILKGS